MSVVDPPPPVPAVPRAVLYAALDTTARTWLTDAAAAITTEPALIRRLFPAARRRCGQARLTAHWNVDEVARAVLLTALPLTGQPLADEVTRLHHHGDPAERRAVLRSLPLLDIGDLALPVVRDALRGNDTTLVEAALGPYASTHLPDAEYRQAVLKCVFCEIPLDRVHGVDARADRVLARMLADFAHERIAAGRDVPQDVWPLLRRFPDVITEELVVEAQFKHALKEEI